MSHPLTFYELFAGAGGLSSGLELAGWECVGHAEIEPHARAVLRHRWPNVRLDSDVAALDGHALVRACGPITLLSGGSPCQDLSVAGKRAGMTEGSGTRSSLFYEQLRLWNETQAPYLLWENVLGALSSNDGRDFAAVLSAIVGSTVTVPADGWRGGGGVVAGRTGVAAWRVLDCQFFGPPQRRRRVFVLGARARGVDPAAVLSLAESVRGHLAAGREAWEGTASDVAGGVGGGHAVIPIQEIGKRQSGTPMNGVGHGKDGDPMYTLQAAAQHGVVAFAQNTRDEVRIVEGDVVCSLAAEPGMKQQNYIIAPVVAYQPHGQDSRVTATPTPTIHGKAGTGGGNVPIVLASGQAGAEVVSDGSPSLTALHEAPIVFGFNNDSRAEAAVELAAPLRGGERAAPGVCAGRPRRLMPIECERLMGWPDRHTAIGVNEKGNEYRLSDSARYKLCGNGVARPQVAWIGFALRAAIQESHTTESQP